MKVSVMQPNVFMWCGLLKSLIDSDMHIIRDDVKSTKNSRYNRNKIQGISPDEVWLTIPFNGFKDSKIIKDQYLDTSSNSNKKIFNLFRSRYLYYPYFNTSFNILNDTLNHATDKTPLIDVYISFLSSLRSNGFPICQFICASDLNVDNDNSPTTGINRLNSLLQSVNATTYLAAENTVNYASPSDYKIPRVMIQKFSPKAYPQVTTDSGTISSSFTPFLSSLDIISSLPSTQILDNLNDSNQWNIYQS